jgi:DNA-binding NtrC family response regulator
MDGKANTCSILFVDDHDDTREAMAKLLRLGGYEVETTCNCADTIAFARQRRFDLLIADLGLPDGSGLELLAQLREVYPINGIVVSGHGMLSDIDESNAAGFARHLTKPINVAELCAAIEDTCRDKTKNTTYPAG